MQQSVQQLGRKMAILRGVVRVRTSQRYLVTRSGRIRKPPVGSSSLPLGSELLRESAYLEMRPCLRAVVYSSCAATGLRLGKSHRPVPTVRKTVDHIAHVREAAITPPEICFGHADDREAGHVLDEPRLEDRWLSEEIVPRESENITAAESSAGLNAERH